MSHIPKCNACRVSGDDKSVPPFALLCNVCLAWFCDNPRDDKAHIISHLLQQHGNDNTVSTSERGILTGKPMSCVACGSGDIFELGYVPSTDDPTAVVFLCEHCQEADDDRWTADFESIGLYWNTATWEPLIVGGHFPNWLIDPKPIPMEVCGFRSFKTAEGYRRFFDPLVVSERQADGRLKRAADESVVLFDHAATLQTYASLGTLLRFQVPSKELADRLPIGEQVFIHHACEFDQFSSAGTVVKTQIGRTDYVDVELTKRHKPLECRCNPRAFDLATTGLATQYNRQQKGLYHLHRQAKSTNLLCSPFIYHRIIGHDVLDVILRPVDGEIAVDGLPPLTEEQQSAVKHCLIRTVTLINGAAGTGKTTTLAAVAWFLVRKRRMQVLACAPTNPAADQLAEAAAKTGLNVVRMLSKSYDDNFMGMPFKPSCAELLVTQLAAKTYKGYAEAVDERDRLQSQPRTPVTAVRLEELREKLNGAEREVVNRAEVIVCTSSVAGDSRIYTQAKAVLFDDGHRNSEPESVVAIVRGARKLIIAGDNRSQGPSAQCAKNVDMTHSLFSRFLGQADMRPSVLRTQHRQHPRLFDLVNRLLYDGRLTTDTPAEARPPPTDFPWPSVDNPLMFYAVYGQEVLIQPTPKDCFYYNTAEVDAVVEIVDRLLESGTTTPAQIGVMSQEQPQRARINTALAERHARQPTAGYDSVDCGFSDVFGGREKDVIVLSLVRSVDDRGCPPRSLHDPRFLLQPSLTRARCGLILVGNPSILSMDSMYRSLLMDCVDERLLVTGPLDALETMTSYAEGPELSLDL